MGKIWYAFKRQVTIALELLLNYVLHEYCWKTIYFCPKGQLNIYYQHKQEH